jgi:aspartate carbamoyltransferase catalytic subunit
MLQPYDLEVIVAEPNGTFVKGYGSTYYVYKEQIYERLPDIDILYMTRHQTERDTPREKSNFVMTNALAHTMKKTSIIMHPLPRTEELPVEIDVNPRAKYFEQAKNGMWVRMGLLMTLLFSSTSCAE